MGGAAVSGVLGAMLVWQDLATPPVALEASVWPWVAVLAVLFLVGNLALQYGAARLRAHVTAVVMLTEVVFASVSAVLLGGGVLTARLLLGGSMILLAALLASRQPA